MRRVGPAQAAFSAAIALHGLLLMAGIRQAEPPPEPDQRISVRLLEAVREAPATPSPQPPPRPLPREERKVEPPPPLPVPRPAEKPAPRAEKPLPQRLETPAPRGAAPAAEPAPAPSPSPVEAPVQAAAEAVKTPALLSRADAPPAAEPGRLADYLETVRRLVETNREYPSAARQLGQQGKVIVRVRILPDGNLAGAEVISSSGHRYLDRAAVAAVRRSAPLKAPSGFGLKEVVLEIPIVFRLI